MWFIRIPLRRKTVVNDLIIKNNSEGKVDAMKKTKKFIALILCVCMSGYALPVFAMQTVTDADMEVQKITLSDTEMSELVGAGSVDATVSDYANGDTIAEAVLVNRSAVICNYTLTGVTTSGELVETIAEGTIGSNTAMVATGPITDASSYAIQARIWSVGVPGMESKDSATK